MKRTDAEFGARFRNRMSAFLPEKEKTMTTSTEMATMDKDEMLKARDKAMKEREVTMNAGKTGKGLRTFLGLTRGRNPQEIQYENWDDSLPETLPDSVDEFLTIRGLSGETEILRRLILGDNEILYKESSDPTAEYVDLSWPLDVQKQFKIVVKNYANGANVSIEDAASLIKPGFAAGVAKASAK